jgi:hypothetical protein
MNNKMTDFSSLDRDLDAPEACTQVLSFDRPGSTNYTLKPGMQFAQS